jgi:hypothetical protein
MSDTTAVVQYDPNQSIAIQKVSQGLFKSGLFPNTKNEFGAFAIVQYGHELGIPPMMSLKNINIISGQLACNAQLMLFLAQSKGARYEVLEETDRGAKIRFSRNGATYTAEFSENDAKAAGLLGKDNWKKYPKDMYFWRAVAKGVRRIAPDAVMGLYTAEEISSGEVIDVTELPKTEEIPEQEKPAKKDKPKTMDALKKELRAKMKAKELSDEEQVKFFKWVNPVDEKAAQAFIDAFDAKLEEFQKKPTPIICPDGEEKTTADCDGCLKRVGCPAWDKA